MGGKVYSDKYFQCIKTTNWVGILKSTKLIFKQKHYAMMLHSIDATQTAQQSSKTLLRKFNLIRIISKITWLINICTD